MAPVQGLGHLGNLLGRQAHGIEQGPADNGVQGQQDEQGDKRPQAAAHGVDLLPLVKFLYLKVIALPIFAVLLLQLLHLAGEQIHLDHALLALQRNREENELNHNGEQDQGQAVAVKDIIKGQQQPGKGF